VCVCVSETRVTPNRKPANNQASAAYNTGPEVGMPMLIPQMNEITNVGPGHQSYTCWQPIQFFLLSYELPTPTSFEFQIDVAFCK
jgi:hypothetical protein